MTRRTSSKYKIDRRVGENIWGRPKSPVNRRSYRPGEHGQRRMGKLSDFGVQLMAKQKLKGHYGDVTERQFRRIYAEAVRRSGNTAENLVGLLESRLDSIVYRSRFVPTIFAARQFVNHGHVTVNGRSARVGSMYLRPGDEVAVGEKGRSMALVLEALDSQEREFPPYIEVDEQNIRAVFTRVPQLSDIPYPVQMEPQLVVEYYSS